MMILPDYFDLWLRMGGPHFRFGTFFNTFQIPAIGTDFSWKNGQNRKKIRDHKAMRGRYPVPKISNFKGSKRFTLDTPSFPFRKSDLASYRVYFIRQLLVLPSSNSSPWLTQWTIWRQWWYCLPISMFDYEWGVATFDLALFSMLSRFLLSGRVFPPKMVKFGKNWG